MLKIGEFSRISRVSIKTLRYYDAIGLLCPDEVNTENGYRYYNPVKLVELYEIRKLKEIGLSLEEIRRIRVEGVSQEELLDLLQTQKERVEDEIKDAQTRSIRIDQLITTVTEEKTMEQIELKSLPEVIVASMRTTIPNYDALFEVVPPMGKIMEKQAAVCREPEYCFNIFHDGEYREKDIDVEICEAVNEFCEDSDGVIYKNVAAVETAASIMHRGDYNCIGKSYGILFQWIEDNGYEVIDNPRESYIDGIWNCESPDDWRTEIQIPIQKK